MINFAPRLSFLKRSGTQDHATNAAPVIANHNTPTLAIGVLAVMCLLSVWGCDRTDEVVGKASAGSSQSPMGQTVATGLTPRQVIVDCTKAYGALKSYQDRGYVQLAYKLDGDPMVDRAPLAVAWDEKGQLGLRVYGVEAGPTNGRFRLRLTPSNGEIAEQVKNQVISRAIPREVNFDWLLKDPIVSDQLSAGLAGFPPQLDLLFSPSPLSGLIDSASELSFDAPDQIDGRACYVVRVMRNTIEYRIWIDQATLLVRRLLVPKSTLDPRMLADPRVSSVQLSIELEDVRANSPVDWNYFSVPSTASDQMLMHFVPRPTIAETTGYGKQVPAFRLSDPQGEEVYRSTPISRSLDPTAPGLSMAAGERRKATVLLWLADHPGCEVAARQLAKTAERLAASGIDGSEVEFVSIWAEPQPPRGLSFNELKKEWNLPGKLVVDRQALGRDLFGVEEAPTLVVIDGENRLQLREAKTNPLHDQLLPGLLARIVRGDDIGGEMIAQNETVMLRYDAELGMAKAIDGRQSSSSREPYPPLRFGLTMVDRIETSQPNLAAAVDQQGLLWVLSADGSLTATDNIRTPKMRFNTTWRDLTLTRERLEVSPSGRYIAYASRSDSRIEIFDTQVQKSVPFELGKQSNVRDLRWVRLRDSRGERLAAITDDSQTALIDPLNREQLSGTSKVSPVAILPFASPASAVGGIVALADGKLERLQLPDDSTGAIGQPASFAFAHAPDSNLVDGSSMPNRLSFLPAVGPWTITSRVPRASDSPTLVAARGWLAEDEPTVFALDATLNPIWHFALPLDSGKTTQLLSETRDPQTGQFTWLINDDDRTIHLFRADGQASDHFRVERPIVGVGLMPSGSKLHLVVVHEQETVVYEVQWNL